MTHRKVTIEPGLAEMFSARRIDPDSILQFSLLSVSRLKAMMRATDATAQIPGETAEVGCAAGGTSRLIASLNGGRTHWACDTFEGLVDVGPIDDRLRNGDFRKSTSELSAVRARLADLPNVCIVPGRFPESAPLEMREALYSLVHLDVDTYFSTHAGFEFFAPRMSQGGVMVIDDVIGRGTTGAKVAWTEILEGRFGWEVIEENDPHVVIRYRSA